MKISLSQRVLATPLGRAVDRFAKDTSGVITVESLIMLPLYIYWFVATFILFDLFRMAMINEKAGYTIADIVSRHNNAFPLDDQYFTNLNNVFDYLVSNRGTTWIRVTSFNYEQTGDEHFVEWSSGTKTAPDHNDGSLAALKDRIPAMSDGDSAILVETYLDTPNDYFGQTGELETFIVTRPRFVPRVVFE